MHPDLVEQATTTAGDALASYLRIEERELEAGRLN